MTKADKEGQRKAPILRFKGFTNDWEQRKLEEVTLFIRNGVTIKQNGSYGIPITRIESISTGTLNLSKVGYADIQTDKYKGYYLKNNDILFSNINSLEHIGKVAFVQHLSLDVIHGMNLLNIRINEKSISSKFIYYQLLIMKYNNLFKKIAKPAVNQASIAISELKKLVIKVPAVNEQCKIQALLTCLEKIITLYDRKLKLLSQVKKYFLDNLFAKKEYPNLRFKGFTDAWEQRKLENLSEHKGGTSIEKYFSSDGLYKVISIGSYGLNNEYIDQGIRAVKNKTTESKLVRSGQLTMVLNDKTANGNLIGRCLLISKDNEFIVNQRTEIIIPGPDLNENYAYYYLNGPFRNKVKKIAQGGTQIYVNYSSVKRQKINYPIKNEQIKISKLLKIIKSLITLYENKQHHLTEIKKTLLNTMFI